MEISPENSAFEPKGVSMSTAQGHRYAKCLGNVKCSGAARGRSVQAESSRDEAGKKDPH